MTNNKQRSMKEFLDDYYVACHIRDQQEAAAGGSTYQESSERYMYAKVSARSVATA
jgi:hypothetical protein